MKKATMFSFLFMLVFASFSQSLDRVAVSAGGIATDQLNATIGQLFVFSKSANGSSLDAGAQSGTGNTGGVQIGIIEVEPIEINSVEFYPNPVSEIMTINLKNMSNERITISIIDISGKLISQKDYKVENQININVSDLPASTYLLSFNSTNQCFKSVTFIKK